jgi:glycosyltransferase involved in cell wall biosynthesis
MSHVPFLTVIIPAYNEVGTIAKTLAATRSYLDAQSYDYEIIVSADGDDGTREKAREVVAGDERVKVIGSAERGGKGRGIRQGVAMARGQIIGFCDADYKTPIEELGKLLPAIVNGCDIAIGSRGVAGSRVEVAQPLYRQIGSRAFGIGMHLVIGLWGIRDTQCGFKFFRGPVARDLFGRGMIDGYMFDVEILHLAERSGYRIKEIGVRWRDDGDSRLELVAGNWRNFLDILRIRFARRGRAPEPAPQLPLAMAAGATASGDSGGVELSQ